MSGNKEEMPEKWTMARKWLSLFLNYFLKRLIEFANRQRNWIVKLRSEDNHLVLHTRFNFSHSRERHFHSRKCMFYDLLGKLLRKTHAIKHCVKSHLACNLHESRFVFLRLTSKNLWTLTGNYSHYVLLIKDSKTAGFFLKRNLFRSEIFFTEVLFLVLYMG